MLKYPLAIATHMFIVVGNISFNDTHLFNSKHLNRFSSVKSKRRKTKNDDKRCYHNTNFGSIPFKIFKLSTTGFSTPSIPNNPTIINIIKNINSISTGPISSTAPVIDKLPVRINFISIVYYGKFIKA